MQKTANLLLVDDEPNVISALNRLLRREKKYKIHRANSGQEGLELLKAHDIGVIVSDQRMPQMNGVEFLREAKQIRPDTVRMILSGYADLQAITDAINEGEIYKFISKPWDDALLLTDIREAFQRHDLNIKNQQFTKVFENTLEGIMITDAQGVIQAVNPAFTLITQYAADDVLGEQASILKSSKHDTGFYQRLWQELEHHGQWTGEIWNKRKMGNEYPQWLSITAVKNIHDQTSQYVSLFNDITAQKAHEENLSYQAFHDSLTDLPNRSAYYDTLDTALMDDKVSSLAVVFIDIDRFKLVNDALGHAFGDNVLCEFSARLREVVDKKHLVARMGGDEFTLILHDMAGVEEIKRISEEIMSAFKQPLVVQQRELFMTPSIGISLYPTDGEKAEILMKHADIAMFRAKEMGRNNYQFYAPEMNIRAEYRLNLENSLRKAIEREEFIVYYQPKLSLKTGKVMGMEALVRWLHPEMGLVSPGDFIPLAEETGLIISLDEWVLLKACQQNTVWQQMGFDPLHLAVNLSGRQFQQPGLIQNIERIISQSGMDSKWLELELTEGIVMQNPEMAKKTLQDIKNMGISLSIDDFGTGYSSLAYLKKFPLDVLKIDQSFVQDIANNEDDAAIVVAIIEMAHRLNLEVVAEGVSEVEQLHFLCRHNCNMMQGFYFSKPIPASEFTILLEDKKKLDGIQL